jgi:hypothetical protein
MASAHLTRRSPAPPATWATDDRGIGQRMLQFEARCALYVMESYYWLVDVAPVMLRYQAEQWWRDTRRNVGYLAADLVEAFDEWLG